MWVISGYCVQITGDVLVKKGLVWQGAIFYALSALFWYRVFAMVQFSLCTVIPSIIGNSIMLFAGWAVFGERLTPHQWLGIAVGMVAVALLA